MSDRRNQEDKSEDVASSAMPTGGVPGNGQRREEVARQAVVVISPSASSNALASSTSPTPESTESSYFFSSNIAAQVRRTRTMPSRRDPGFLQPTTSNNNLAAASSSTNAAPISENNQNSTASSSSLGLYLPALNFSFDNLGNDSALLPQSDLRRNKSLPYRKPARTNDTEPLPESSTMSPLEGLLGPLLWTMARKPKPLVEYEKVPYPTTDITRSPSLKSVSPPLPLPPQSAASGVNFALPEIPYTSNLMDDDSPLHITAVNIVSKPLDRAPSLRHRISIKRNASQKSLRRIPSMKGPKGTQLPKESQLEAQPVQSKSTDYYAETVDPLRMRAFAGRAVSFQRRQWFTNLCCISLCPLLMIMIAFVLKVVISNLSSSGSNDFEVLYCSNETSINEQNWPIYNLTGVGIFVSNASAVKGASKTVRHVNFLDYSNLIDLTARAGLSQLVSSAPIASVPCVNWFGSKYPVSGSNIYERPNYNKRYNYSTKDSVYSAEVSSGWLDILAPLEKYDLSNAFVKQALSLARSFALYQTRPWAVVGFSQNVNETNIGTAPQEPLINSTSGLPNATDPNFKPASAANGMLDTIEPRFWVQARSNPLGFVGFQKVPYFEVNKTLSPAALDARLKTSIQEMIQRLAKVDTYLLRYGSPTDFQLVDILNQINNATSVMPYGAIYFDRVNHTEKEYVYTLQFGKDSRLTSAPGFPTAGFRTTLQQAQLTNSILRFSGPSTQNTVITQGLRSMPVLSSTAITFPIGALIGRILYPLGISFLLPVFTIGLVRDKEARVLAMMRMNGLSNSVGYYVAVYVTNYILYTISTGIFVLSGYLTGLDMFVKTDMGLLILLFFLWGHVQIALSFWFNSLFARSRIALVTAFLVVVVGVVTSFVMDQVFVDPGTYPTILFVWPPFAFYRALGMINRAATSKSLLPFSFRRLTASDDVGAAMIAMSIETIVFLVLSWYLANVLPTGFGSTKPWHFPVSECLNKPEDEDEIPAEVNHVDLSEMEDDDVRAERKRVMSKLYPEDAPLIIRSIAKRFGKKTAVYNASFAVEKGVVFGLLGPNGAGKTTLINVLTSVFMASSGSAKLAGHNINTDPEAALRAIGVCPQFDILWPDLSVDEHLYFFARLKGVAYEFEREAVQASKELVRITQLSDRLAKQLSGGERRRLSIAIALVGNPKVVFLDEPTTGLDPEVRRAVWDIIARARGNRAILLTTHSMEEAEVCCQRIGIMAKGIMRCTGSPARLKELYGAGYNLIISGSKASLQASERFLKQILPKNERTLEIEKFDNLRHYVFRPSGGELAFVFESLERFSKQLGIDFWGISQTTLDEIFTGIISEEEAAA